MMDWLQTQSSETIERVIDKQRKRGTIRDKYIFIQDLHFKINELAKTQKDAKVSN